MAYSDELFIKTSFKEAEKRAAEKAKQSAPSNTSKASKAGVKKSGSGASTQKSFSGKKYSMSAKTYDKYENEYARWQKTGKYDDDHDSWYKREERDLWASIRDAEKLGGKSAKVGDSYVAMDKDTYKQYDDEYNRWKKTGKYTENRDWYSQEGRDAFVALRDYGILNGRKQKTAAIVSGYDWLKDADESILDAVAENYKSTWEYDLTDAEDVQRRENGQPPKNKDKFYNFNDETEAWLFERGLPTEKSNYLTKQYQKAMQAAEKEAKKQADAQAKIDAEQAEIDRENDEYLALYAAFQKDVEAEKEKNPQEDTASVIEAVLRAGGNKYQPVMDNYAGPEADDISELEGEDYLEAFKKQNDKKANPREWHASDINTLFEQIYGVAPASDAEARAGVEAAAAAESEGGKQGGIAAFFDRLINGSKDAGAADTERADVAASRGKIDFAPGIAIPNDARRKENPIKNATPYIEALRQSGLKQNAAVQREKPEERAREDEEAAAREQALDAARTGTAEVLTDLEKQLKAVNNAAFDVANNERELKKRDLQKALSAATDKSDVAAYNKALEAYNALESEGKERSPKDYARVGAEAYEFLNNLSKDNIIDTLISGGRNTNAQGGKSARFELRSEFNSADAITPEEIRTFNEIAETAGAEAAGRFYIDELQPVLDLRLREQDAAENTALATEHPIVGSIMTVAANLESTPLEGAHAITQAAMGRYRTNDPAMLYSRMVSGVRGDVAQTLMDNGGIVPSFLYQTGMSMADSVARMGMGNAGLALMALGVAGSAIDEAIDSGASARQALTLGVVAGAVEYATEKVSLDTLLATKSKGLKGALLQIFKTQGLTEAGEEGISQFVNMVADAFIRADDAEIKKTYQAYIDDGETNGAAIWKTMWDAAKQIGGASLGGYVSGIFFGMGGQTVVNYQTGRAAGASPIKAVAVGGKVALEYEAALQRGTVAGVELVQNVAQDLQAIGLTEAETDSILDDVDNIRRQPAEWVDKGVQTTLNSFASLTEGNELRMSRMNAEQEVEANAASIRLSNLMTNVRAGQNAAAEALASGDLASHTRFIQQTTEAIEKYNQEFGLEKSKQAAVKAAVVEQTHDIKQDVRNAAENLHDQIPGAIDYQMQKAAEIEAEEAATIAPMGEMVEGAEAAPETETELTAQPQDAGSAETAEAGPLTMSTTADQEAAGDAPYDEGAAAQDFTRDVPKGTIGEKNSIEQQILTPQPAQGTAGKADVINEIVNGGKANGRAQNGRAEEAGDLDQLYAGRSVENDTDNGRGGDSELQALAGTNPTDRLREGNAQARQGGTRRQLQGRGERVTVGSTWTEDQTNALHANVEKINEEIRQMNEQGATFVPIDPNDLIPITETDPITAEMLKDLSAFSGREVYLYQSQSGRTDLPGGFSDGKHAYLRYTGENTAAFHFGHEIAEGNAALRAAGKAALKKCGSEALDNYILQRTGDIAPKDRSALEKEFICDMFGAFSSCEITKRGFRVYDQLGVDAATATRFTDAFGEELEGVCIEETDVDAEAQRSIEAALTGIELSENRVSGEIVAEPATAAESKTLHITDPRNVARYRNEITDAIDGTMPAVKMVLIGKPSEILEKHMGSANSIYMPQTIARKIFWPDGQNGGKHDFGRVVLDDLPYQLNNPLAITGNTTEHTDGKARSVVVWTDWVTEAGDSIVVPIRIDVNGNVGTYNNINSVFDLYDRSYERDLRREGNILYTRNGKSIDDLLTQQREVLKRKTENAFSNVSIRDIQGKNNQNTENSQFVIKGRAVEEYDPEDDANLLEAFERHMEGGSAIQYDADPDANGNVAAHMRSMERTESNIRVFRRALELYNEGVTPAEYWERSPRDFNARVAKQLLGIRQRNGLATGGRLAQSELDMLTRDALRFPQFEALTLNMKAPVRLFEDLGRTRRENTPENIAANYEDGVRMRDAYVGFADAQNAKRYIYIRDHARRVHEAFGKGTRRESAIVDLLGQQYITEQDAKAAVFDKEHMLVPSEHAIYIFGEKSLGLMSDIDKGTGNAQTVIFDDKYRKAAAKLNEDLRSQLKAAKSGNDYKRLIERAKDAFKAVQPIPIKGASSIVQEGNAACIYLPDGTLYARIENGKGVDMDIVKKTDSAIGAYFKGVYRDQNRAIIDDGYPAMGWIENYRPHRMPEAGSLKGVMQMMTSENLPAWINGQTANRKPGRPYTGHVLERMGEYTDFDAIEGFDTYLPAAADLIYMTPVIQRFRQFGRELREISRSEAGKGTPGAVTANGSLAAYLDEMANLFANKKPMVDRGMESLAGRKFYVIQDFITGSFGASAVAGNVSVAMSNLIGYFETAPQLNFLEFMKQTGISLNEGRKLIGDNVSILPNGYYDCFADRIPFLTTRRNEFQKLLTNDQHAEKFLRGVNTVGKVLFETFDYVATESVARTKYAMLRKAGYTREAAATETSMFLTKAFANRTPGMTPLAFKSRALKPFTQFLLEPYNQMGHMRDIALEGKRELYEENNRILAGLPPDAAEDELKTATKHLIGKKGWKEFARAAATLVCLTLYNELIARPLKGNDQTWNPYRLAKGLAEGTKENGFGPALLDTGKDAIEQSVLGGFVGGGRIPVTGALDNVAEAAQTLIDGEETAGSKARSVAEAVLSLSPYGAQASKTLRGIEAINKGGSYTKSGRLRYPLSGGDFWKAAIFGPSAAAPEGFDYAKDTLSEKETATYKELVGKGYDPDLMYNAINGFDSTNSATKALSLLVLDADGDGKPDLSGEELDVIALSLGVDITKKKAKSLAEYAEKAEESTRADIEGKLAGGGLTGKQREAYEKKLGALDDYSALFRKMY